MSKHTMSFAAVAGLVLALAPAAQAATISFLGSDITTLDEWRSTSGITPTKTAAFDPNGDNVYGNDGHYVIMDDDDLGTSSVFVSTVSSISYITSVTNHGTPFNRNDSPTDYPGVDDPTLTVGTTVANVNAGVTFLGSPSADPIMDFVLATDSNFVLTVVLGGNTDNKPSALSVTRTVGGSTTDAAIVPAAASLVQYLFFEIDGLSGDEFDIVITGSSNVGIGGVAFEQAIPEPSSFALAALGLLGLVGFRRRRKRA
jgi:hypothetical protein